jgi:hypothetical protein
MIEIEILDEHRQFIEEYGPHQTLGGYSNLDPKDLGKASRLEFQYTGIYGELGWYLWRYGSYDKLRNLLDIKVKKCKEAGVGDGGYDDHITCNNKTRLVDIKSSHVSDEDKIPKLNLVVPTREYHQNMIYVGAFTVGPTRKEVKKVILAGWTINENITDTWYYDPSKYAISIQKLTDLSILKKIL